MDRRRLEAFASITQRANLVVYIIFFLFALLGFRLWYLSVANSVTYVSEAFKSRKLTVRDCAMRGTIRDRFNIVLATNVIAYRVGISWPLIQEIPRSIVAQTKNGEKKRIFLRKEYVKALASLLAQELSLDASRVEDVIHSYAIFASSSLPFFLKTELTEAQYYRLNMLAKDWQGLVVERISRRVYPQGTMGCHVVGYIASQNQAEFHRILLEKAALQEYVSGVERGEDVPLPPGYCSFFAVKARLLELERKAYTMNDAVGKTGVEAAFEGSLRGLAGKKCFVTNAQGEIIRRMTGSKEPVSGKRLILSLSSELQKYCEGLLAQDEKMRRHHQDKESKKYPPISGGAIVAIDPNSFEVIACASHPKFNPNDFVRLPHAFFDPRESTAAIRWARGESFFKRAWNLEWPLDESSWLSWTLFIESLMPKESAVCSLFASSTKMGTLLEWQKAWNTVSGGITTDKEFLLDHLGDSLDGEMGLEVLAARSVLRKVFEKCASVQEKFLIYDLSRLLVRQEEVSDSMVTEIAHLSIDEWRQMIAAKELLLSITKKEAEEGFRAGPFAKWREEQGIEFLKYKRMEEKEKKIIAKPFLHYLDKECSRQFSLWWGKNAQMLLYALLSGKGDIPLWLQRKCSKRFRDLVHDENACWHMKKLSEKLSSLSEEKGISFLSLLHGYDDLLDPLLGEYGGLIRGQDLIRCFFSLYPSTLASFAYMQPQPQGSIFKLAVAYAALEQRLEEVGGDPHKLDPSFFTMTDKTFISGGKLYVGSDAHGKPIPQMYKGGRIPKSVEADLGHLDLVKAIEKSSNPYFALLAGDYLRSPDRMLSAAALLGYGQKTGILLPNESKGRLPSDLEGNKTGVYTTAIGQHTLLATPLQASVALSALFSGEMAAPKILRMAVGSESPLQQGEKSPFTGLMQAIGISFPIWVADAVEISKKGLFVPSKLVKRTLPMTEKEREILEKGMRAVCVKIGSDPRVRARFKRFPAQLRALDELSPHMLGKSSTAQSLERIGLRVGQPPLIYNHIWFASVFPKENASKKHDLVVVVFLRYGVSGKEAAPLAASVAHEWRRIQKLHALQ